MYDDTTTYARPTRSANASQTVAELPWCGTRVDDAHQNCPFKISDTLQLASLAEVGAQLVATMSTMAGCRAMLAVRDSGGHRFRLVGDSQGLGKQRRLPPGDAIEQALADSCMLGVSGEGKCLDTTFELVTPLRKELSHRLGVAWTRVCLLADTDGQVQGAWVLCGDGVVPDNLVNQLCPTEIQHELAAYLSLRRDAETGWWERCRASVGSTLRAKRTAVWAILFLGLGALCAMPVPHYIGADCQCEPATRRILTAPFDAQLAECLVKPGDVVHAGQLVARFEGTEIASEIESLEAEQNQIQLQHYAALAKGDASVASEAALELRRISGQLSMVRQRQQRLELRSPINGTVVSGDLEDSVGASLAIGQRLLEIAPLERVAAEIYIDESDISLVTAGQPVTFRFEGTGATKYETKLARIFPRAEMLNGENVYVAEGTIEGEPASLTPGMRGRAKVYDGWRPLAWMLFRKPYLAMRQFWGWY